MSVSDEALLRRHVRGDSDAFTELVRRHRDRLWAVALRTLGNPDDAADALQDALLAAFRRADTFRGDSAVTTWLHRIVVNACLDKLRQAATRRALPLPDGLDPPAPGLEPGAAAALHLDVMAALATLPDEQRLALVLVDMQGYPVAEVARMLDCPVGTVKSRCARGRAALLPLLSTDRPATGNQEAAPGVTSVPNPGSGGDPR